MKGYQNRMPLDDPEIRGRLGVEQAGVKRMVDERE